MSPPRARHDDEPPPSQAQTWVDLLRTTAEDLLDLVSSQIRLARVEVVTEASQSARRALQIVVFIPIVVGGYLFAMAAIAWWLSGYWGPVPSLAVVSACQLLLGGVGAMRGVRAFRAPRQEVAVVLGRPSAALKESLSPGEVSAGDPGRKVLNG